MHEMHRNALSSWRTSSQCIYIQVSQDIWGWFSSSWFLFSDLEVSHSCKKIAHCPALIGTTSMNHLFPKRPTSTNYTIMIRWYLPGNSATLFWCSNSSKTLSGIKRWLWIPLALWSWSHSAEIYFLLDWCAKSLRTSFIYNPTCPSTALIEKLPV